MDLNSGAAATRVTKEEEEFDVVGVSSLSQDVVQRRTTTPSQGTPAAAVVGYRAT